MPGARNVEIKARVADLAAVEARAAAIADSGPVDISQDDTFFTCPRGRLKLRQLAPDHGQLIHYQRPDQGGPKLSDYVIAPTPDPAALREALTRAYGVAGRVRKHRRLYLAGRTRIHLDRVEGLGDFMELEVVLDAGDDTAGGEAEARRIMLALGVDERDLIEGAYVDLMAG
ncbi:MAG: adenylate cyclase [Proteobacteria bacterium]|nr:adenylate cyclase [Pseudomonadota bacterium]